MTKKDNENEKTNEKNPKNYNQLQSSIVSSNKIAQKHILIVDDEPYNLIGLEMVIKLSFKMIGI